MFISVSSASLSLNVAPGQVNPSDTTLNLQAAIKNLATNAVFYFTIPYSLDVLFTAAPIPDVQVYAQAWKGFEESLEVSQVVNGKTL